MSAARATCAPTVAREPRSAWLPLALRVGAVVLVGALIVVLVRPYFGQLRPKSFAITPSLAIWLGACAVWSFGFRTLRWHVLLRRLLPRLSLGVSARTQLIGFTFAVTPGRVAELYKLRVLERETKLPVSRALPAFFVERLTDAVGFGVIGAVGGGLVWSGHVGVVLAVVLALGLVALALALRSRGRWTPSWLGRLNVAGAVRFAERSLIRIVPRAAFIRDLLNQLIDGAAQIASVRPLALSQCCVFVARLGDAMIVWQVASAVGHPLPFSAALFLVGAVGLTGGFSLSPGGMGAAEAAMVALVLARGIPLDAALTISLVSRALVFWAWVALGFLLFLASLVGGRAAARGSASV